MRALLSVILFALISSAAHAEEKRTYKKVSSSQATVTIKTEEQDGTQVAIYTDGQENAQFIQDLLKDKNSKLYQVKQEIEKANCGEFSSDDNPHIPGCGEVTVTNEVRTSFGRGGWASCGSGYTFFMGFTSEGTGRFFDVSHMVTITEYAEAVTKDNGDYAGSIIKTLDLAKVVDINDPAVN
jgi:hypothetical protein